MRAHVGGAATEAATAIGAEAYATGSDVAFAREPDLHTAAHEAAHVVQQRAGVQLYGGVGEVGDRYERHADQVADRVVAGQSVEALLSELTPGPTRGTAVQLRQDDDGDSAHPDGDHRLARGEASWPVFAASGKPYLVEARGASRGAWVVRDW